MGLETWPSLLILSVCRGCHLYPSFQILDLPYLHLQPQISLLSSRRPYPDIYLSSPLVCLLPSHLEIVQKGFSIFPPSAPFQTPFLIAHFSKGTPPSHSIAYDMKLETISDLSLPHHLHLFSHQVLLILSSKYIFNISISLHLHYPHLSHIYLPPGLHICFLAGLFTSTLVLLCPLP